MKTGLYLGGTPIGKIVAASTGGGGLSLQSKNINPTKQTQIITANATYDALSQVIVNPIPNNYITTETTSASDPDQMEAGTTIYMTRGGGSSSSQGSYINLVISTNSNTYPDDGISGNYWYVKQ